MLAASLTLTYRDIQILEMIYDYDTCSADHIRVRLFGTSANPGKHGPKIASYRRIAILKQAGYISTHRLSSLTGVGSGKHLLSLIAKGREVLAREWETSRSEIKTLREIETPHAGAHHLAVCDVRLNLEMACQRASSLTLEWVSERELRTPPITKVADPRVQLEGKPKPDIPLIADGRISLTLPDGAGQSFELEVDMATISTKRMLTKLAGYFALSRRRPILVLWVVPDTKRLEAIATWALMLSHELGTDPSIFWITTKGAISPETVLSPIWQVIGGPEAHSLLPESYSLSNQPAGQSPGV